MLLQEKTQENTIQTSLKFLIGWKQCNDPKAFLDYSNDMNDIDEDNDNYNQNKNAKYWLDWLLIMTAKMMISNKTYQSIVTELFIYLSFIRYWLLAFWLLKTIFFFKTIFIIAFFTTSNLSEKIIVLIGPMSTYWWWVLVFKGTPSGLRQFLATESHFYFILKAFFTLKILNFLSWLFGHVEKRTD